MASKNSIVQRLARGATALSLGEVPAEIVDAAKRSLIDICGVTIAGATSKSAQMFSEHAIENYAHGPCHVIGGTNLLNPAGAAFANGTAAHALDFDDNCYAGIVHGSAVVFPSALAMAQQMGASGGALLEGFIVGLEVEFAVGNALSNSIYDHGWWTTSVLGAIGSAAGAARVAGLDEEQTAHALALAFSGTGAVRAVRGTSAKHYYCGRAAESGVAAALLAIKGAKGPLDVFEDQNGVVSVLNNMNFDDMVIDRFGREFGLSEPGIDIKKYPVCYASHAAMDGTREIATTNNLQAGDIAHIVCTIPPIVASNLTYKAPKTSAEAQFSLEYALAVILQFGDFALEHLNSDAILHAGTQKLIGKIEMRVGDIPKMGHATEAICPEWADIELFTTDGKTHRVFVGAPIGSASRPMSEKMLRKKFQSCLDHARGSAQSANLYRKLQNIEKLENTRALFVQTSGG